jgi:hypothetical protein
MEHAVFKNKMLSMSIQKVYEECRRICFYECVQEYFLYCEHINREFVETAGSHDEILSGLWDIYLKNEHLGADTWDEIEEMLKVYAGKHETKEAG